MSHQFFRRGQSTASVPEPERAKVTVKTAGGCADFGPCSRRLHMVALIFDDLPVRREAVGMQRKIN
jgi:hypothetical protein